MSQISHCGCWKKTLSLVWVRAYQLEGDEVKCIDKRCKRRVTVDQKLTKESKKKIWSSESKSSARYNSVPACFCWYLHTHTYTQVHTFTDTHTLVFPRCLGRFLHDCLSAVFWLRSSMQRVCRSDVITLDTLETSQDLFQDLSWTYSRIYATTTLP